MNSYYLTSFKPLFRRFLLLDPYNTEPHSFNLLSLKENRFEFCNVAFLQKVSLDFSFVKKLCLLPMNESQILLAFLFSFIYLKRNTVVLGRLFLLPDSFFFSSFRDCVHSESIHFFFTSKSVSYLYIGLYLSFSFVTFSIPCAARVCNRQNNRSKVVFFVQTMEKF